MVKSIRVSAVAAAALGATLARPADAETIRTEVHISTNADAVWTAIRDVYHVDKRLVPGLVTSVQRQDDVRVVTFANGFIVKERIVTIDDAERRLAYSAFGGKATYHMASMQVFPDKSGSKVVWITDFLPVELTGFIKANMGQGMAIMKRALERPAGS
jgi:carbon monoxide dehydrogenase subunit G